jgi:hypothetical protein
MGNQNYIKATFISAPGFLTLTLIFIHQGIIAISAIFLTETISRFQSGNPYKGYLALYFISMTLPYLPGYLSFIALQSWINRSHCAYINAVIDVLSHAQCAYRNSVLKRTVESAAARSSFIIIRDSLLFTHGFVSFLLNSSMSLLVIGIILPGNIFAGYAFSIATCTMLILGTSKLIGLAALKSENSFVRYTNVLAAIWPNITLKNQLNSKAWGIKYRHASKNYYGDKLAYEAKKQLANLLLSVFALTPTIYLVYETISRESTPALVAAVIVNLTRIFHILSSLSSLISDGLEWPAIRAKLKILFVFDNLPQDQGGEIDYKKIEINSEVILNLPEKTRELMNLSKGRFTVRGSNGAGKSTLLLALKESLGHRAVYMPLLLEHLVWSAESIDELSTGQMTIAALATIIDDFEATHLLLDEWDANLDSDNTRRLDRFLDQAALQKVNIEVRH